MKLIYMFRAFPVSRPHLHFMAEKSKVRRKGRPEAPGA